jgi:hypothetical protein
MHISAYFLTLASDIALLLTGGSACISQSSAGQKTLPVMELRWGRAGYLASVILPMVERVHDITDLTKPNTEGSAFAIQRSGFGTTGPIAIRI